MAKQILEQKEPALFVDVDNLTTITEFIKLQKENGRKPCTKPGIYYAMKKKSIKFITIAGKHFIYINQKAENIVVNK
ncbi:MAG TPA: hypothetical protein VN922_19365 [Bacteroidia bacterium]|nr:hypothetical protein [Bacteroidia bacterium]